VAELTRAKLQLWVVIGVLIVWGATIIGAVVDGTEGRIGVRLMTPAATLVLGWLFAVRASNGA
jgi:hypothetical protein